MASLVRNFASGMVPASQVTIMASEQAKEITRQACILQERESQELRGLQNRVNEFERESGVKISNKWESAPDVGKAVRAVLHGRYAPTPRREWERLQRDVSNILATVNHQISKLDEVKP